MTKYSNTPRGYDMCTVKDPWWRHPVFPLIPQYEWSPGDEWNANSWFFSWLWFRVWSLEFFSLELSAELDSTGLNIKAIIPYLRIVIRLIPLPEGTFNSLRRRPAHEPVYDHCTCHPQDPLLCVYCINKEKQSKGE